MINAMKSFLNIGSSEQNVTFAYIVMLHPTYIQKVSEYDQEIPQSLTEDQPTAPQNTHSNKTSVRQQKKATSSLFLVKMIAKLERTQSDIY